MQAGKMSEIREDALASTKLPRRTVLAAILILLCIPLTLVLGFVLFDERSYYLISLIIIILAMLPFILVFEGRRPQAREVVMIAVMVAIGVAGRAAFFMVPQFKPVVAIVIIAGISFGAESGFIVGALTGFVSNFLFGQGPWTPWQMFAFGSIGFLAGLLFRSGNIAKKRIPLCAFGGLATFIIYGLVVDTASVLMFTSAITPEVVLTTYIMGIPFNIVHAAATVIFLLLLAIPVTDKLTRIKKKYGLVGTK
jgi:energy-coupling factor transport system substrate-specific component